MGEIFTPLLQSPANVEIKSFEICNYGRQILRFRHVEQTEFDRSGGTRNWVVLVWERLRH